MSLQNSFNKIKRSAGIKKCVMIDGNVGDVYLDDKKKIVTLREYLESMLKEMDYPDIVYWDRVEGATGAIDKLKVTDDVEVQGDAYDLGDDEEEQEQPKGQSGLFKAPSEILNVVYKNVIDRKRKVAFILNWSEYLFGVNGLSEDERQNITLLGKALKDRKVDYLDSDCNESVVIMILNKTSGMPISFYQGNPEVEIVTLQKPDREERKAIVEKIEDSFNVKLPNGTSSLLDVENSQYIDMLEDFTNREIIQLSRLSRKEEKTTFDKLFYLFKYGEKENPWEKLEYERVKNIKKELSERVVGQDEAIEKIEKTVIKAYMGLTGLHKTSSRSMPKGVFFFVGPTGVGKTELSKALAQFLFGDEQACIRFDMSEYAQENSDQKLIGAAPGYVGYDNHISLIDDIKTNPFSIILVDEIEKSCNSFLNLFLQLLDEGFITTSTGEKVYFNNSIIIFTSNITTNTSMIGFNQDKEKVIKDKLTNILSIELLNRINHVIQFNKLTEDNIRCIIKNKIMNIKNKFKDYNIVINISNNFIDNIIKLSNYKEYGARKINKLLEEKIDDIVIDSILNNEKKVKIS